MMLADSATTVAAEDASVSISLGVARACIHVIFSDTDQCLLQFFLYL